MAKKSNIKTTVKKEPGKAEIIQAYIDYLLKNHDDPESMYQFAGILGIKESEIYKHFASFTAIKQTVFEGFFEQTVSILEKDKLYTEYDAKNKLLSFYYIFFEILKENRSYVILVLKNESGMEPVKVLQRLRSHFITYIDNIGVETINFKNEDLDKIKQKGLKEMAWGQLLATLKYWISDDSPDFEKTDLFIEKSLKASFELINTQPLESIIDFTKFLFREKLSRSN
ncbi:MAG: TetR/AcrR family transcriptional regulator [Cyclobacteriaceae bacterium]|nr:TetR/AcrR family transcriptional regulator [Cyclobacteriaceae bacterium SS2]